SCLGAWRGGAAPRFPPWRCAPAPLAHPCAKFVLNTRSGVPGPGIPGSSPGQALPRPATIVPVLERGCGIAPPPLPPSRCPPASLAHPCATSALAVLPSPRGGGVGGEGRVCIALH